MSSNQKRPNFSLSALLCAVGLNLVACSEPEAPVADGSPNPLYVFGVDGATWDIIDRMIGDGELPNFARMKAEGSHGRLITVGPQVSPVVWTTLATGHFGRRHGILDFVYPYTPGSKRPVESGDRLEPAIWNIASAADKRVVNIGYFSSYPAETINGVNVSDRSLQFKLPRADYPENGVPDKLPLVEKMFSRDVRQALFDRYFQWPFNERQAPDPGTPEARAHELVTGQMEIHKRIVAEAYYQEVTRRLIQDPVDLFITYFRLTDYMGHGLYAYYDDTDYEKPIDPALKSLLGNALPESYRFMDEILGEMLAAIPANANLIIISDHGFGSATGAYKVKEANRDRLTGNHRPDGLFAGIGPDLIPGEVKGMTIMEIAPLMLALTGLSISDELPGRVPYEILEPQHTDKHPINTVAAYDYQAQDTRIELDSQAQEDAVRSLQGLGYVSGSLELGDRAGGFDFWATERENLYYHVLGEITYALLNEDLTEALAVYQLCEARRPEMTTQLRSRVRASYLAIQGAVGADVAPQQPLAQFLQATRKEQQN